MPVLAKPLNKTTLRSLAGANSFIKGNQYHKQSKVREMTFDGVSVKAQVKGSGSNIYQTVLNIKDENIMSYHCSCPAGGFCKHLVALGLYLIDFNSTTLHRKSQNLSNSKRPDLNTDMSKILLGTMGLYTGILTTNELISIYRAIKDDTSPVNSLKTTISQYHGFYRSLGIIETNEWQIKKSKAHEFVELALESKYAKPLLKEISDLLARTERKYLGGSGVNEHYYARLNYAYYTNNARDFTKYLDEYNQKSKFIYGNLNIDEAAFFISTVIDPSFNYSKLLGIDTVFVAYLVKNAFMGFVRYGLKTKLLDDLLNKPIFLGADYEKPYLDSLLLDLRLNDLEKYIQEYKLANDPKRFYLLLYEASIYFLRGQFDKAMKLYNDGLKLERKTSRNSQNTVAGINAIFYILSLIKADKFKNKLKIERCVKKNSDYYSYLHFQALQALLIFQVEAKDDSLKHLFTRANSPDTEVITDRLFVPLLNLFICFYDKDLLDDKLLAMNFENAVKRSSNFDIKLFFDVHSAVSAGSRLSLPSFIKQLELPSLVSIFPVTQAWERKLDLLKDHFGISSGGAIVGSKPAQRFVWIVDIVKKAIVLKKQQQLKSGAWSSGKVFDLHYVSRVTDNEALLSLQEKNIIDIFIDDDYYDDYDNDEYPSIDKALIMLCGMKNVFSDDYANQRLDLVLSKPCLELKEDSEHGFYKIKLSHDFQYPTVFLERTAAHACAVIACGPELLKLKELLGSNGIELPLSAETDIKNILKSAEADLEVVSDLDFEDLPIVAASTKPYVLVFFDAYNFKLRIEILMNPTADSLSLVQAGSGRDKIKFVDNSGEKILYLRDFDKEHKSLLEILQELGLESANSEHEGVDACLDLIGNLEALNKKNPEALDIEWKQGDAIKVATRRGVASLSMQVKSKNNWFEYSGEVKLDDDKVLSLDEIMSNLATSSGSYVKLNNGEFLGLTDDLKKSLHKLKYLSDDNKLHKLAMDTIVDLEQEGASVSKDKVWQQYLDKLKGFDKFKVQLPNNFKAQLRDYQYDGFVWLSRLAYLGAGACLADDMGLGKTVQAIAVLLNYAKNKPCMVVAPTSIVNNWQTELDKFASNVNAVIFSEIQADAREQLINKLKAGDILLCSYGLLQSNIELLEQLDLGMLILDESQAIKNPLTKRAIAAKKLKADFRLVLSGTPIENNLSELWSQFDFINPGLLGSLKSFQGKFANAIEINKDKIAQSSLKQLIQPYMLRRIKSQVLTDLPPKIEQTVKIEFDADEAAFYEVIRKQAIAKLESEEETNIGKRKLQILAEMSKLRRACCHPSLVNAPGEYEGAKNKEFLELVNHLKSNQHKALVFSQYTSYLKLLRPYLDMTDVNYLYLDGSTPAKKRKELVKEFQEGDADLFLLSLKAGGSGLNLTNADYVIHLDPWWNPAVEDQATDRAHRIGQSKTVNVYRLIMKSSIEEKILAMHESKRELADELLDEANMTAKLSDKELLGMMKL